MKNANKAALIGLVAVLLWSAIIGLIRSVTELLGPTGGAAMVYSLAAVFVLLSVGHVKLSAFPRRYLGWGSLLFVTTSCAWRWPSAASAGCWGAPRASMRAACWPTCAATR